MATLGTCRFCRRFSAHHTHDECTREYGIRVEKSIMDHYSKKPEEPLTKEIIEKLKSKDWKFYVNWKKEKEEFDAHVNLLQEKIRGKAEELLKENHKKLNALLSPFGSITFVYHIECKTIVSVELRC